VQLVAVKVPVLLVVKPTEPDGTVAPVAEVSVTVAVHVEVEPTVTIVQTTVVLVEWTAGGDTVTGSHALLTPRLLESPE
jgi:hypothetical protein